MLVPKTKRMWLITAAITAAVGMGGTGVAMAGMQDAPPRPAAPGAPAGLHAAQCDRFDDDDRYDDDRFDDDCFDHDDQPACDDDRDDGPWDD